MTTAPVIALLTDFGIRDSYVGQMKAVLVTGAPTSTFIDITHEIEPFAIDEGAWLLETILPVLPPGTVVLAVVDPGVGSARRALAVRLPRPTDRDPQDVIHLVGPDNGLLSAVVPNAIRPNEIARMSSPRGLDIRAIESQTARQPVVSDTFHGRDIFAPAAALIALEGDHRSLGPPLTEFTVLPPFVGQPTGDSGLRGTVIHIDHYGNLVTTLRTDQLPETFCIEIADQIINNGVRTFSDAPTSALAWHIDSSGFLAIAAREASAATLLGTTRGATVVVRPR